MYCNYYVYDILYFIELRKLFQIFRSKKFLGNRYKNRNKNNDKYTVSLGKNLKRYFRTKEIKTVDEYESFFRHT